MKTEDTEALGRQRAKPTKQDQSPIQLTDLCLYTVTQRQFLFIFPFLQTNITSQMWPTRGKGEGWVRLNSLKGEVKNVTKNVNIYSSMKLKTQKRLEDRAQSKQDSVDRPVRTDHTIVHH